MSVPFRKRSEILIQLFYSMGKGADKFISEARQTSERISEVIIAAPDWVDMYSSCWVDRVDRISFQQVLIDREEGVCTDGVGCSVVCVMIKLSPGRNHLSPPRPKC